MTKILRLFPYDDTFPALFRAEMKRLKVILGEDVVVEHVGSTAVAGLGGKGIVDIAIGVSSLDALEPTKAKLVASSYYPDDDHDTPKDRIFLASREHDSTKGDFHLHLAVYGDREWRQFISFRDRLRKHKELRDEYMNLKTDLHASTKADRELYRQLKGEYIQRVVENVDE